MLQLDIFIAGICSKIINFASKLDHAAKRKYFRKNDDYLSGRLFAPEEVAVLGVQQILAASVMVGRYEHVLLLCDVKNLNTTIGKLCKSRILTKSYGYLLQDDDDHGYAFDRCGDGHFAIFPLFCCCCRTLLQDGDRGILVRGCCACVGLMRDRV